MARIITFLHIFILYISFSSCVSSKKQLCFIDQKDPEFLSKTKTPQSVVQNNDLLGIAVSSLDPGSTVVSNAPNITSANASSPAGFTLLSSGDLVNSGGNTQFPLLASIKASGNTIDQLREEIIKNIIETKLLADRIVNERFLNIKLSVSGEVQRPIVVNVPNDKTAMLEARGIDGDITMFEKEITEWSLGNRME